MKKILWDKQKAENLLNDPVRNITFERCVVAIESGHILNNIENPARNGQNIFILEIDDYAYVVPYVEDANAMYFKTIYPSRKYTKLYLRQV
jgi:hypothetical protein